MTRKNLEHQPMAVKRIGLRILLDEEIEASGIIQRAIYSINMLERVVDTLKKGGTYDSLTNHQCTGICIGPKELTVAHELRFAVQNLRAFQELVEKESQKTFH